MKKIIVLILMLCSTNMALHSNNITFCDNMKTNVVELLSINKDYDFKIENEQLGKRFGLELNDELTIDSVYKTYNKFCRDMCIAEQICDGYMSKHYLYKSIDNIVKGMSKILKREQFRNFIQNFNIMMYQHGFLMEAGEYCNINNKINR